MPLADCEYLVDGWLAQPVNALSSLAFVLVGIGVPVVARRRSGRPKMLPWVFGGSLVLVGLGSLAFHGPGGTPAGWLHDASITTLLVLIVTTELGSRAGWSGRLMVARWAVGSTTLIVIEWVWTGISDPLNGPLTLLAVGSVLVPEFGPSRFRTPSGRNRGKVIGAAMVGVGAVIMLLSRTGGPLCAPHGLLQGHAIWHVLAAMGIGVYAVSVLPVAVPGRQSSKLHT